MHKHKGFTLIELLIVIAIIGILTSVVISSLNIAREKGANAAIKQNLNTIRSQAEVLYDDNSTYAGLCANETVLSALASANTASGGTATCNEAETEWAVSSPLKGADGVENYWCVDSINSVKTHASELGSATVCP